MPEVYILLPVHNRKEVTRGFVECLQRQTFTGYHLVLMDDGSTDGTAEMVREYIPGTTVLRGNGTWWWAGSLQRGLDWLKENVADKNALILFINDDVHFAQDYLERAMRIMADKSGVLMLSRYRNSASGEITESGVTADLTRLTFKEAGPGEQINCLSTRGLFVHWGDVKGIGDFHPRLLPHYLSDYEYTMRACRKGFKCETSSDLLIEPNEQTTGYHVVRAQTFPEYLKKYFSKRSAANPIYFSSFVLLTCSPLWIVANLARLWAAAVKDILRKAMQSTGEPC